MPEGRRQEGEYGHYGPNFQYDVIPEPSTLVTFTALLGMGLIGYLRRRPRNR
jgi:hypothetical protein